MHYYILLNYLTAYAIEKQCVNLQSEPSAGALEYTNGGGSQQQLSKVQMIDRTRPKRERETDKMNLNGPTSCTSSTHS